MKVFKSNETEEKLLGWINVHPESWHPNDNERFYEFVFALLKNNESITKTELAEVVIDQKSWKDQEFIDDFLEYSMDKIYELKSFHDYLLESNRIMLL